MYNTPANAVVDTIGHLRSICIERLEHLHKTMQVQMHAAQEIEHLESVLKVIEQVGDYDSSINELRQRGNISWKPTVPGGPFYYPGKW